MFAPHCTACDRRVLLGLDRLVRLTRHGDGDHRVLLRCYCGELVEWLSRPSAQVPPAEPIPA